VSRAATSRLKVNPPLGSLPVLQYCSPEQLQIDPAYQRSLEVPSSQTLIRRIAVHWDWGLCQPLSVARRIDGGLYVVDGQHRLEAARLRGDIQQLPCVVTMFASAAEEAASFVALNQQRRPLNRLQLFRAALAANDQEAATINRALASCDMWIGSSNDLSIQKPGALTCVAGLENCLRVHGSATLTAALEILSQSFKGERYRYAGTLFPGIAAIVADEVARDARFARQDGGSSERFILMVEMISGAEQRQWAEEVLLSVAAGESSSRRMGAEKVFRKAWAECLAEALDEAA
jgi:hypothetical protein